MQLETILDSVIELPPTPQILPKLQRTLRNPESSLHDIVDLLKVDAALAAQIVRLSNSAYFRGVEPCQSINEAVGRIGFQEVYRVVSFVATESVLNSDMPLYKLNKNDLVENSVACAVGMSVIGPRLRLMDVDSAYTTGLLHSIGKVIINQYYLKHGVEIYGEEAVTPTMERQVLGFDNAQAGGAILRKWNFAEEVSTPIEYQYTPADAPEHAPVAALLMLVCAEIPAIRNLPEAAPNPDEDLLKIVNMDAYDFEDTLFEARDRMAEAQKMFVA